MQAAPGPDLSKMSVWQASPRLPKASGREAPGSDELARLLRVAAPGRPITKLQHHILTTGRLENIRRSHDDLAFRILATRHAHCPSSSLNDFCMAHDLLLLAVKLPLSANHPSTIPHEETESQGSGDNEDTQDGRASTIISLT